MKKFFCLLVFLLSVTSSYGLLNDLIILKNHNLPLNTQSGREAEWLAGWVSIFHLKNSRQSIKHFEKVFNNSDDEIVKAKAAFWLSRSFN